jgi:DNA invertase Pin-like site-specific DNA recombinase
MPRRVAIYVRISLDRGGEGLGVQRQREDCLALAVTLGWIVVEVYEDNDISASKNVPRPAFERLMRDLESGVIDALIVYDLDRLTRKPAELEKFMELADRLKIPLANPDAA